jgi:hypothetical protein
MYTILFRLPEAKRPKDKCSVVGSCGRVNVLSDYIRGNYFRLPE